MPAFNEDGDLPPGVYPATLSEVLQRFGQGSALRCAVAERLGRIYGFATSTGKVARFVVFGSLVTAKAERLGGGSPIRLTSQSALSNMMMTQKA